MCLQEFVSVWRFVHLCVILSSSAQEPDLTDAVQMIVCAVEILLSLTRIFTSIWNSGNYLQWHKPAPSALNRSVNDSLYFRASFHIFFTVVYAKQYIKWTATEKSPSKCFFHQVISAFIHSSGQTLPHYSCFISPERNIWDKVETSVKHRSCWRKTFSAGSLIINRHQSWEAY